MAPYCLMCSIGSPWLPHQYQCTWNSRRWETLFCFLSVIFRDRLLSLGKSLRQVPAVTSEERRLMLARTWNQKRSCLSWKYNDRSGTIITCWSCFAFGHCQKSWAVSLFHKAPLQQCQCYSLPPMPSFVVIFLCNSYLYINMYLSYVRYAAQEWIILTNDLHDCHAWQVTKRQCPMILDKNIVHSLAKVLRNIWKM